MPIFLKIDSIEGDTTMTGHAGEIEASAVAYGIARPSGTDMTAKAASGPPSITEVAVTKVQDHASLPLTTALITGRSVGTVTITFAEADKDRLVDYLTIEMEDTRVSSVHTSSDGDRPTEQVSFSSPQVRWTDLTAEPKPSSFGYDFASNQTLSL